MVFATFLSISLALRVVHEVSVTECKSQLKSLSPLFFSIFDEKLSHPWIQIKKKQLNFLRLSMGFDRKKIKI